VCSRSTAARTFPCYRLGLCLSPRSVRTGRRTSKTPVVAGRTGAQPGASAIARCRRFPLLLSDTTAGQLWSCERLRGVVRVPLRAVCVAVDAASSHRASHARFRARTSAKLLIHARWWTVGCLDTTCGRDRGPSRAARSPGPDRRLPMRAPPWQRKPSSPPRSTRLPPPRSRWRPVPHPSSALSTAAATVGAGVSAMALSSDRQDEHNDCRRLNPIAMVGTHSGDADEAAAEF
jgi:hypothetical protein